MVDGIQGPGGTGFNTLDEGTGGSPDLSGNFDDLVGKSGDIMSGDSMYFLKLQQQVAQETRAFETISNVLKARDSADKSAINNIGR